MSTKLKPEERFTIEEYLAFTDERPDGERWELIEGIAYMQASPTDVHQMITTNIGRCLQLEAMRTNASWLALIGIGTVVPLSPNSLPQPDAFVMEGPLRGIPTTDDALVLFEVLSRSNTKRKLAWRQRAYASIPNCQHYVTVSQTMATLTRHDRADGWKGTAIAGIRSTLALPALGAGVAIPLAEIYRSTPLAKA